MDFAEKKGTINSHTNFLRTVSSRTSCLDGRIIRQDSCLFSTTFSRYRYHKSRYYWKKNGRKTDSIVTISEAAAIRNNADYNLAYAC